MRILFIVDQISQPRCIKRVSTINDAGYQCLVYGYDRGKYNVNSYPTDVTVTVLGKMSDNKGYLKKFVQCWRDIRRLIDCEGKDTLFYAFGFLSALCLFVSRAKYVYEISDILYAYPKFNKVLRLFKWLDKRIILRSRCTVMTSAGFMEFLGVQTDKIVLLPNMVNSALAGVSRKAISIQEGASIVFAFVGAVRYQTILEFAEIIGRDFKMHEFHFYGQASGKTLATVMSLTENYPNVKYYGAFRNPQDLEKIYSRIHVVIACYPTHSLNERLAEPNKLYEAILFCKPIVVSDGIYLAKRVKELGCGYAFDSSNKDRIRSFISQLSFNDIIEVSKREKALPLEICIDNQKELIDRLSGII